MLILGIDPGLATIGFGLVLKNGDKYRAIEYGAITTAPKQMIEKRLGEIYDSMIELIQKTKPDCMVIEDLGADSLDIVEMLMTLEDEMNIIIPDDATGLKTVKDIATFIENEIA